MFEANTIWVATCITFVTAIMITVNVVARRSADKWREAEEAFEEFEELGSVSTLSRLD